MKAVQAVIDRGFEETFLEQFAVTAEIPGYFRVRWVLLACGVLREVLLVCPEKRRAYCSQYEGDAGDTWVFLLFLRTFQLCGFFDGAAGEWVTFSDQ